MRTYLLPLLLLIILIGAVIYKYETDLEVNRQHYTDSLRHDAGRQKDRLESTILLIQQNLHMVANLPDIRAAGRDVSKLNAGDFHIIQQVFSTLRDNVGLTSLYIMAPQTDVPVTTQNPMLPMLALNPEFRIHPELATLTSEFSSTRDEIQNDASARRLVRDRMQLIRQHLERLRGDFPDLKSARAANYPGMLTVHSSAPQLMEDGWKLLKFTESASVFMFIVPVYGSNGQMSGAVIGTLPVIALLKDLVESNPVLIAPTERVILAADNYSSWRDSWDWLRQGKADPNLIFSNIEDIHLHDQALRWLLWSSRPDADFWRAAEVKSAETFAWSSGIVSLMLCVALMLVVRQQQRHRALVEQKNIELEQNVMKQTCQLRVALDESKRASAALASSESRHKAIFDNSADGIIIIDKSGVIESINPAALSIFGYSVDELTGRNISALMPEPYQSQHDQYLTRHHATGISKIIEKGPRELEGLRKDGHSFPLELQIVSMEFSGKFRYLGILRDITKRKQVEAAIKLRDEKLKETEKQLLQSEKMASVGQLAAGVAHEINNPIGYVNSNLTTLMDYVNKLIALIDAYEHAERCIAPDNRLWQDIVAIRQKMELNYLREDLPDLMNESRAGIERVRQIVQDLKEFSHVETIEWQPADIHTGINSTLNIVHNKLKYKADVIKRFGDLPVIECIPAQLNQVFLNLLVNACHAIDDRGTITITSGRARDAVWVEFCDTGKGIEAKDLGRIFEPFYTTKPVGEGTGLGLSLSYGIIQKHHGRITATSEPGQGTCFRIELPISQREYSTG